MKELSGESKSQTRRYVGDRRQWPRSRSDAQGVTLWTSATDSQPVDVHDESLTGIALLVEDVSKLYPNREVRLAFTDRQLWAIVRHIQTDDDGKHRVGLEWGCSDGRFLSHPEESGPA